MGRIRALALGAATALFIVTVSGFASSSTLTAAIEAGTVTLCPGGGPPRATVKLVGSIPPKVKHQVNLQRRDHGAFVTLATKNTDAMGGFTFKTSLPQGRSKAAYRVFSPPALDPATGEKRAYATPSRTATITTGVTIRVTDRKRGSISPAVSADGRYLSYLSLPPPPGGSTGVADVWVIDRVTDTSTRITRGNAWSYIQDISGGGRYITFSSDASNLTAGDTNGQRDVFMWDRVTDTTTRITNGDDVSDIPSISGDGRYISFSSLASNLVPGDTNGLADVFVWDRVTATTTQVTNGNPGSGFTAISSDGRYVSYTTIAPNYPSTYAVDVFVWDRATGTTAQITKGNAFSGIPAISGDGRYVAYVSFASNLVPGDENGRGDVFVWDRVTGTTTQVTNGNRDSGVPAISADGRYITYYSRASDLVHDDTNEKTTDVFVWERATDTTTRITYGHRRGYEPLGAAAISADGHYVAYHSYATDLVCGDTNGSSDLFLWDRKSMRWRERAS